jgi:hypothetical protein
MAKNRLVNEVIRVVLEIIPESETTLINELKKYKRSLFNQAPESLSGSYCWIQFLTILNNHIHDIKEEWQIKIRDILKNNGEMH